MAERKNRRRTRQIKKGVRRPDKTQRTPLSPHREAEGKSIIPSLLVHVNEEDYNEHSKGRKGDFPAYEAGLYSLVLSSKLPTAKKFKRWVTSEVLPSIRQNGAYSLNMSRELRAVIVVDQRVTKVQEETNALRQDFEVFKQDMPILGVEETKITEAVKRKGVECLGGKESPAYRNKGLRSRVYQDIYRELKRQFGVTTYKAIKRNQTNEAVKAIDSYHLPLVLKNQVDALNAQTGMWKVIG